MANTAKNAILRAKLNGVITELLVKTNTANVIVDDKGTTLAAHLQTLATAASVTELDNAIKALGALAKKDKVSQSDFDEALASAFTQYRTDIDALGERMTAAEGKVTTLIGDDAGKSVRTIANEELAKQLIPENAAEALNELQEIAAWIQSHPGDASAMNEAIQALQTKVDTGDKTVSAFVAAAIEALKIGDYAKVADLGALASKDKIEMADFTDELAEGLTNWNQMISTLVGEDTGKSARTIAGEVTEAAMAELGELAKKDKVAETDLDTALAEKVNAASEGNHAHLNKDVLDGITAEKVAAWDGKATIYYTDNDTAPEGMVEGDMWVQLVD